VPPLRPARCAGHAGKGSSRSHPERSRQVGLDYDSQNTLHPAPLRAVIASGNRVASSQPGFCSARLRKEVEGRLAPTRRAQKFLGRYGRETTSRDRVSGRHGGRERPLPSAPDKESQGDTEGEISRFLRWEVTSLSARPPGQSQSHRARGTSREWITKRHREEERDAHIQRHPLVTESENDRGGQALRN
jgi:hypothetical protein